jgi:hypothetical protein
VDRIIELDLGVNAAADLEMLRPNGECVVYGSSVHAAATAFLPADRQEPATEVLHRLPLELPRTAPLL